MHDEETQRLREQLSAWMDGELGAEESRFLLRRLQHDDALRAEYERWQLARTALRRQPMRVAHPDLAHQVRSALAGEAAISSNGRRWLPWAAAASLAVALLVALPNLRPPGEQTQVADAAESAPTVTAPNAAISGPGLSSADLVVAEEIESSPEASVGDPTIASAAPAAQNASPRGQLPTSFDIPAGKPWPKSALKDDAAMDALLIRHGEMARGQGVGGFTPFVDVVAEPTPDAGDASKDGNDEAASDDADEANQTNQAARSR